MTSSDPRQQLASAESAFRSGQLEQAERILLDIVRRDARLPRAFELLGYINGNRGRMQACEDFLRQAAALPDCGPEVLFYLGRVQLQAGRAAEAVESLEACLRRAGEFFEVLHELGVACMALDQPERALQSFQRAERKNPRSAELHANMGSSLAALKRYAEAIRSYERALQLDPRLGRAWTDRGWTLEKIGRRPEALRSFERALAIDPEDAKARMNRAMILTAMRRHAEALADCEVVARVAPDTDYIGGYLLHLRMHLCRWDGLFSMLGPLLARVDAGEKAAVPFTLMATPATSASLLAAARTFAADDCPVRPVRDFGPAATGRRIRVAYLSADFRSHATSQLMAGVFECHDRERFECFGYWFGAAARDEMTERVAAAFEHYAHVGERSDSEIAGMLRDAGIDIAIDLHGFTQGYRAGIFADRAAPIQVNYLAFPGSMGCDFIDYIVADAVVIPPANREFFSEKIVLMPHSYQANDNTKAIAESLPSRESMGLPAEGFVFACFNNNYKITPDVFDVWMRLLARVPGSVLWLLKDSDAVRAALESEAGVRGIDPARIVWAGRVGMAEHLARHAHADLFIDTFHYGAHTTASDSLWSGLPVLTRAGATFPSRVAASLLHAAGLPELVTDSIEDYEALALELARSPERLAALRQRLRDTRLQVPLFDTPRFTRYLESAFEAMHERRRRGLAPDHIRIEA